MLCTNDSVIRNVSDWTEIMWAEDKKKEKDEKDKQKEKKEETVPNEVLELLKELTGKDPLKVMKITSGEDAQKVIEELGLLDDDEVDVKVQVELSPEQIKYAEEAANRMKETALKLLQEDKFTVHEAEERILVLATYLAAKSGCETCAVGRLLSLAEDFARTPISSIRKWAKENGVELGKHDEDTKDN